MRYAVVDIETTGGYAAAAAITEIAILVCDENEVIEQFDSLVNPDMSVPRYITGLTGITNEMVECAPFFHEIADRVFELLNGNVFVAHSVNFDYSFVRKQLDECGYKLDSKKLCTARLSRAIVPGLKSYSLGNICAYLDIPIEKRHRADGDAFATVQLFHHLLRNDEKGAIKNALKRNSREYVLPPNTPKSDFDALPYTAGVYYFHNRHGKVIYVGKAKNIRRRVSSHFSNNSTSRQKQEFMREIFSITFEETGSEMMAALLESQEIKKLWPELNRSQKRFEQVYGIFDYEDQNGYLHLVVEKVKRGRMPLRSFNVLNDAYQLLGTLVREFELCYRLCHFQSENSACNGVHEGTCKGACVMEEEAISYNQRLQEAIESLEDKPSFIITDRGRTYDEIGLVYMQKGHVSGTGYASRLDTSMDAGSLLEKIKPVKHNFHLDQIARHFTERHELDIIPVHNKMFFELEQGMDVFADDGQ